MYLLTSNYDANKKRNEEFKFCLEKNKAIGFDQIFVMDEAIKGLRCALFDGETIFYPVKKRPSYNDFFAEANKYKEGSICVIANADIYFSQNIHLLNSIDLTNKFIVLTRYNLLSGKLHRQSIDDLTACSDAWAFKTPVYIDSPYEIGVPFCDGKVALNAYEQGYKVLNLSKDITIVHVHDKDYKNPLRGDKKYKGRSLYVYMQHIGEENAPEPIIKDD